MLAATLLAGADETSSLSRSRRSARGPPAGSRPRSALVAALAQRTRELEAERDAATRLAVRHERARIARELHDIVADNLAVMVVQAGAGRMAEQDPPERARERFDAIRDAGEQALAEMARLTDLLLASQRRHNLRPLLDRARRLADDPRPQPSLDETAYRVRQEAVTNVLKHAPGAAVEIRLTSDAGEIEVRDSGAGTCARARGDRRWAGSHRPRERRSPPWAARLEAGPRRDGGWGACALATPER